MTIYPWTNVKKELEKRSKEIDENKVKCYSVEELESIFDKEIKMTWFESFYISVKWWFHDLVWDTYRFFKPCHQRIRKVIPKRWCDLTELTLLVNFEIIKSFVEEEMHNIDWESEPEHKKAGEWLKASYKYITETKPRLEKELSEAYKNVPKGNIPYEEKYKDVNRIEKTIEESDKAILIGIANYRQWLWS